VPGMMARPPFTVHTALTDWQWGPFALLVLVGLITAAWWYLRADWRLAMRGRRWPAHRRWAFLAGLVAIDLALQSPVAAFTSDYFQAHIVQHLLLMVVAPPLLALGAPSTLLLQTSSRAVKVRWLAVLRSRPFAVLTHPVIVAAMYFGSMFVFFLTPLINVAMTHMALMDAINLFFLFGSCTYWWPLVGLDPIVHWKMGYGPRMLSAVMGGPIETVLSLAILSDSHPIASMYTLASTHSGADLLWGLTELATALAFIPLFVQWVRSEERRSTRDDAREDRRLAAVTAAAVTPTGSSPITAGSGGQLTTGDVGATGWSSGPAEEHLVDAMGEPDRAATPEPSTARSRGLAPKSAEPAPPLSAWEAEWLARTGSIPGRATAEPTA
jgi:putative membrane protein